MSSATLILSKPLEGKKEVIDSFIKKNIKEGNMLLFALTDKNPEQVKQELLKEKIFFKNLYFIDCYSQQASLEVHKDSENIKYIPGPLALNELSIALSEFAREFIRQKSEYTVIFDSLSTLLMYSNADAIGRFLQVLIAKIKQLNGNIIFTLVEGMHDQRAVVTLEHLMDSIIEVKKEGNKIMTKESGKNWAELKEMF